MINKLTTRKGVTPVIAIVLLLTVTIGAVGILYTQVGDLLEQDEGLDDIDRVQDTELEIRTAVSSAADDELNDADGVEQIYLSVANEGDRAVDLGEEFDMSINGVAQEAYGSVNDDFDVDELTTGEGCLTEDGNMQLDVGETTSDQELDGGMCTTGIPFPGAFDDSIEIQFELDGSSRTWSYECNPPSGDVTHC